MVLIILSFLMNHEEKLKWIDGLSQEVQKVFE
jgi:hypothetical protein